MSIDIWCNTYENRDLFSLRLAAWGWDNNGGEWGRRREKHKTQKQQKWKDERAEMRLDEIIFQSKTQNFRLTQITWFPPFGTFWKTIIPSFLEFYIHTFLNNIKAIINLRHFIDRPTIIKLATSQQDDDGFSNEKLLKTHQTKPITSKQIPILRQPESLNIQPTKVRVGIYKWRKLEADLPHQSPPRKLTCSWSQKNPEQFADMPSFQPCANIRELEAMKHFKAPVVQSSAISHRSPEKQHS